MDTPTDASDSNSTLSPPIRRSPQAGPRGNSLRSAGTIPGKLRRGWH